MFTPTLSIPNIDTSRNGLGKGKTSRGGQPLSPEAAQDQALTDNTRKWVAGAFFGTLLKQMHESPFKSDLWNGGRGGEAFSTMYDQKLTERMSRGVGQKLVRSIVRRIEGAKGITAQKAAAAYTRQRAPLNLHAIAPATTWKM